MEMLKKGFINLMLIFICLNLASPAEAIPVGPVIKPFLKLFGSSSKTVLPKLTRQAHEAIENIEAISKISAESSHLGKSISQEILIVPNETRESFIKVWLDAYAFDKAWFQELLPLLKASKVFNEYRHVDELLIQLSEHEAVSYYKLWSTLLLMSSALGIPTEELDAARVKKETSKFMKRPDMYIHCLKLEQMMLLRTGTSDYKLISDLFPFCPVKKPSISQIRENNKKRILDQRTKIKN